MSYIRARETETETEDRQNFSMPVNNDSYIGARERQTELVLNAQSIMTVISGQERQRQRETETERDGDRETETGRQVDRQLV